MASPLRQLVLARIRESLRHPETIFWTFVFPILLAVALGIAFRGERIDPVRAVVVDAPGAEEIARGLRADRTVRVEVLPRAEADQRLRTGRTAILVLPGDPLLYRYDPTRPDSRLARERVDRALQAGAGRTDPLRASDSLVTEPGARYIDFLVPGLLGMNLMGGGLWGIGWVVVEDRIRKLLKLQLATPMRKRDFLLAHVLARLLFVPLEVVPLLFLSWLVFGVSSSGALLSLAAVATAGALSFAGLGTLLASRARTTATISGLINLATFPMIVVSGVFFSVGRFPGFLQPLIRALPLSALVDGLRGVMTDGAQLSTLWPQFLVMGLWGTLCFVAALWLFRWT
ncbi:MAG TPA: ABC transporter permease [Deltaproteobacteria bacterium]|nr:ABC transporter permease [Deltaproteobacteria bacterium]